MGHAWLPQHLTRQFLRSVPTWVDPAGFESAANWALFRAAATWDPARGIPFAGYATQRIRWALQDAGRDIDHLSRGDRAQFNKGTLAPSGRSRLPLSWDVIDWNTPGKAPAVDDVVCAAEEAGWVRAAVAALPARHRLVVTGWLGEVSPTVLGAALGVTPARVPQLRAEAFAMLRDGVTYLSTGVVPTGKRPRKHGVYLAALTHRHTPKESP